MVMSASDAADNYKSGIKNKMEGGVDPYKDAMDCSTPKCAAEKLVDARKKGISLDDMKKAYKNAYSS